MVNSASDGPMPTDVPNLDLDFEQAAKNGDIKRIHEILEAGATVDGTGNLAYTPLMQALYSEQLDAAKLLIAQGADLHRIDSVGYSCFSIAAEKEDPAFIELLFEHCDKSRLNKFPMEYNPLVIAAKANHAQHVQACVRAGMDINTKDESDWTPLHHAFLNDARDVMKVLFDAKVKIPPYFLSFARLSNKTDAYDMLVQHLEQRTAKQTMRLFHLKHPHQKHRKMAP